MKGTVSWLEVNNWVPIIVLVVTVSASFFMLQTRLALIEQRVGALADSQKEMIDVFKSVETRYGELSLKVNSLEVVHSRE